MNVDTIVAEKAEVSTMIHCGSQAVTLYDVAAAPLPESTGTFVPVPHFDVLCELTDQVHERGWEFYEPNTEKQYKIWLSKNGLRMAAYTIVQIPGLHHKDGQSAIGITNGNDRIAVVGQRWVQACRKLFRVSTFTRVIHVFACMF